MTSRGRVAPRARDAGSVDASPTGARYPFVDATRALAALSVLVFHVGVLGGLPPGSALHPYNDVLSGGVTLFFLVSGFLLYRPFVLARARERPVDLRSYARKRALRILPGYWVALTVLTAVFGLPGVFTADWWRYYGLVQIYDLDTYDLGMGVAWTLCIEATFYLLLPLYSWGVTRALGSRRHVLRDELLLLAAGALVAVGFSGWVYLSGHDERISRTLLGTFDWFAVGMAYAVLSVHRPAWRVRRPALLWAAAGAVVLSIGALAGDHGATGWFQLLRHLLVGLAAALVLAPAVFPAPAGRGGIVERVLRLGWLRWLGVVSYGLYLYHATLIPPQLSRGLPERLGGSAYAWLLVTTLVLAGTTAALSWYLVERPASAVRRRPRRKPPAPGDRTSGGGGLPRQRVADDVSAAHTSADTPRRSSSARTSDT